MSGDSFGQGMAFGPYHILRCLASGEQAEVYLARGRSADGGERQAALKVLMGSLGADPGIFSHIVRHMRPALDNRHPAVVSTLELHSVGDIPGIVMEYVEGVDLGKLCAWLRARGRKLPLDAVLWITRQALLGLERFHTLRDEAGQPLTVVHGNLHPGNVLVSTRGEVKVADFIVALILESMGGERCRREEGRAEDLYRSPEQATGDAVDLRTDIFSAGLLLYEGLAGAPAYDPAALEDPGDLEAVICEGDIEPIGDVVQGLPTGLETVVMKALAPDPAERFFSARQMLDALAPCITLPREEPLKEILGGLAASAMEVVSEKAAPSPQVMAAPSPEETSPTQERQTRLLSAEKIPKATIGHRSLDHTRLTRILRQQDQAAAIKGEEPVRQCTLFWSLNQEQTFIINRGPGTSIMHWTPEGLVEDDDSAPARITGSATAPLSEESTAPLPENTTAPLPGSPPKPAGRAGSQSPKDLKTRSLKGPVAASPACSSPTPPAKKTRHGRFLLQLLICAILGLSLGGLGALLQMALQH